MAFDWDNDSDVEVGNIFVHFQKHISELSVFRTKEGYLAMWRTSAAVGDKV
jgi:hypothetical protein